MQPYSTSISNASRRTVITRRGIPVAFPFWMKPRTRVSTPVLLMSLRYHGSTDLVLWLSCSCLPCDIWQHILSVKARKLFHYYYNIVDASELQCSTPHCFRWCSVICIIFFVLYRIRWCIRNTKYNQPSLEKENTVRGGRCFKLKSSQQYSQGAIT